jgi:hypothetical protein
MVIKKIFFIPNGVNICFTPSLVVLDTPLRGYSTTKNSGFWAFFAQKLAYVKLSELSISTVCCCLGFYFGLVKVARAATFTCEEFASLCEVHDKENGMDEKDETLAGFGCLMAWFLMFLIACLAGAGVLAELVKAIGG